MKQDRTQAGLAAGKILVFVPNPVGDAVMSTPALAALRARFPGALIVAAGRPGVISLLDGIEFVDEFVPLEALRFRGFKKTLAQYGRLFRALRERRYDLAVLLTNSFVSALFARILGIGVRVGYRREWRGWLLTHKAAPPKDGMWRIRKEPVIGYYLRLLEQVGADAGDGRPRLCATEKDSRAADSVLAQYNIDSSRPIAVLDPSAGYGAAKCWTKEGFAAVADALWDMGYEVVVQTPPGQKDIGEGIAGLVKKPLKPVWRSDIPLGTLKGLIKRAALLVGNDTGPRHIAAAFDVPAVTIMGPTDPAWSHAGYPREVVVRKVVDCAPCTSRVCPTDHKCMTRVLPADVIAAVREVLERRAEGEAGSR